MSAPNSGPEPSRDGVPESNKALLIAAGICLMIPIVALMWVTSYAKEGPELWDVPFFFWYQFAWVILCSVFTYTAHRLVIAARKPKRGGDR